MLYFFQVSSSGRRLPAVVKEITVRFRWSLLSQEDRAPSGLWTDINFRKVTRYTLANILRIESRERAASLRNAVCRLINGADLCTAGLHLLQHRVPFARTFIHSSIFLMRVGGRL